MRPMWRCVSTWKFIEERIATHSIHEQEKKNTGEKTIVNSYGKSIEK